MKPITHAAAVLLPRCTERQSNRYSPDFECRLPADKSHTHHIDPSTGMAWNHPTQPRGMRRLRKTGGASPPSRPKSYWSSKPVKEYKPGPVTNA